MTGMGSERAPQQKWGREFAPYEIDFPKERTEIKWTRPPSATGQVEERMPKLTEVSARGLLPEVLKSTRPRRVDPTVETQILEALRSTRPLGVKHSYVGDQRFKTQCETNPARPPRPQDRVVSASDRVKRGGS